jgi:hypothetical protein
LDGLAGSEFARHETKFDEGPYASPKQAIVNLVYVREVVDGMSSGVFIVHSEFVKKDAMKSDILHICDLPGRI